MHWYRTVGMPVGGKAQGVSPVGIMSHSVPMTAQLPKKRHRLYRAHCRRRSTTVFWSNCPLGEFLAQTRLQFHGWRLTQPAGAPHLARGNRADNAPPAKAQIAERTRLTQMSINSCLEEEQLDSPPRSPMLTPRLSTASLDSTMSASPELGSTLANHWHLDDSPFLLDSGLVDCHTFLSKIELLPCAELSQADLLRQLATSQLPNQPLTVQLTNPNGSQFSHTFQGAFLSVMTIVASESAHGGGHAVRLRAWQNDEEQRNCSICKASFSWSTRKHHCRCCGRIVCSSCSPHRACATEVLMSGPARQVRVCDDCNLAIETSRLDQPLREECSQTQAHDCLNCDELEQSCERLKEQLATVELEKASAVHEVQRELETARRAFGSSMAAMLVEKDKAEAEGKHSSEIARQLQTELDSSCVAVLQLARDLEHSEQQAAEVRVQLDADVQLGQASVLQLQQELQQTELHLRQAEAAREEALHVADCDQGAGGRLLEELQTLHDANAALSTQLQALENTNVALEKQRDESTAALAVLEASGGKKRGELVLLLSMKQEECEDLEAQLDDALADAREDATAAAAKRRQIEQRLDKQNAKWEQQLEAQTTANRVELEHLLEDEEESMSNSLLKLGGITEATPEHDELSQVVEALAVTEASALLYRERAEHAEEQLHTTASDEHGEWQDHGIYEQLIEQLTDNLRWSQQQVRQLQLSLQQSTAANDAFKGPMCCESDNVERTSGILDKYLNPTDLSASIEGLALGGVNDYLLGAETPRAPTHLAKTHLRLMSRLVSRRVGLRGIASAVLGEWRRASQQWLKQDTAREFKRVKRAVVLCGSVCYSLLCEPETPKGSNTQDQSLKAFYLKH
jgi:hypothetical protein